ncbi:hypothetical protein BDQ12DRAFT_689558 [Crucibulum laeve]|uniref:Uncharacterized protein n=1 Tax=Crucibulum laeve TaxID=68775 RepID=A0A5C3LPB5_9AGAR|nr:hypothetical protein BDQ12DRAFT_689558 [Crucibulum laeve]
MAAPSQEFPSWLTPSVSIITDAAGIPISTSTTVLFLPLTYFGPSIPLGPDWIYGGLTSPGSTPTASSTDTTAESTTETTLTTSFSTPSTAIPTSSEFSSVSLSSSFASSLSSSGGSSLIPSGSTTAPSSTASAAPAPVGSSGLPRGQLIGVIVAGILGVIFLFVFAIVMYLWCKGRPNRLSRTRFSMITPIEDDYLVVGPGGRSPGEGSPRHSGEEADPFLQRSRAAAVGAGVVASPGASDMKEVPSEMGSRPRIVPRVAVPGVPSGSLSSSGSSNNSGYGEVVRDSRLRLPPDDDFSNRGPPEEQVLCNVPAEAEPPAHATIPESEQEGPIQRRILTPAELERLEAETQALDERPGTHDLKDVWAYTALTPPPRLVDPEKAAARSRSPFRPADSFDSQRSLEPEESATLLTARRVKVQHIPPARSPLSEELGSPSRQSGGFLGSLGLGSLRPSSWFKKTESPRTSQYGHTSFTGVPLSDNDLESGRSMLTPQMAEGYGTRRPMVGFGSDGERPISGVSARSNASGGTVYHDANSSLPGTPRLTPLPRAITPSEPQSVPEHRWASNSSMAPPAYEDPFDAISSTIRSVNTNTNVSQNFSSTLDILDMPAPSAVSPFTSSSSLRDTASGSTRVHTIPYPPGLEIPTPKVWTDMSTGATPSPGSFAAVHSSDNEAGISIDVLEEAPPSARPGWRDLARVGNVHERRSTFGLPIESPVVISEQGSLFSMRSDYNHPSRASGSAPNSIQRDLSGSIGSGSSQPSAARTGSSGAYSIAHSLGRNGSISSDDQRRRGLFSPALSAFGHDGRGSDSGFSPVASVHLVPERASRGSGHGAEREPSSPLSPSLQLNTPWAAGLGHDWTPT